MVIKVKWKDTIKILKMLELGEISLGWTKNDIKVNKRVVPIVANRDISGTIRLH